MTFLGIFAGLLGAFLIVWVLGVRRLPFAQQPGFSRRPWFRGGVPALGLLLFLGGFGLALRTNWITGGLSLLAALVLSALLLRHDQYSAMAQILLDDYHTLKRENPEAKEFHVMYSIVKSRRPLWNEDRITEFCSGKDIKQLVLLLLLLEYEIHPLNDMKLYENLKAKVERLGPEAGA